ncbi:hypothetical protein HNP24_002337 [Chryseobacterium sediminis]|uniref:Uncharacterized protein n=1 Tax=Chryseobacterium sediminis TaxID=1679494 RepID=A0ABR6Q097_9FLAO|nr:hypothetical protein [Chryseobacterium sediminis]
MCNSCYESWLKHDNWIIVYFFVYFIDMIVKVGENEECFNVFLAFYLPDFSYEYLID